MALTLRPTEGGKELSAAAIQPHSQSSQALAISRTGDGFSDGQQIVEREKSMASRRQSRDEQHYKQIWTKDAHGGPYRKVGCLSKHAKQQQDCA